MCDLLARLDLLRRTGHRQVAVRHHAKRVVLERASLVGGQPGAHGVDDAKLVGNLAPDLPHGFRDSRRVPTLDDDTGRGRSVSIASVSMTFALQGDSVMRLRNTS